MIAVSALLFGAMSGWLYLGSYKKSFDSLLDEPKKPRTLRFLVLTMLRVWLFLPFFTLLSLCFRFNIATVLCGAALTITYLLFVETDRKSVV